MRLALLALSCIAALSLQPVASAQPGFVLSIDQSGFSVLKTIILDFINKEFSDISLPDQHIDTHVPEPLGHITLDLTDIKLTGFEIQSGTVTIAAPADFDLKIDGIDFDLNMNYKWRKVNWPHASDHGTVSVKPSGGTIGLGMRFSVVDGVAHIAPTSTTCSFSSFDIHFDHGAAWLYNLLIDLFKKTIGKAVDSAVEKELTNLIGTTLNGALEKIPSTIDIGGGKSEMALNVTFGAFEAYGSSFVVTDEFAFSDFTTKAACPYHHAGLPPVSPSDKNGMLQLILADTVLSCPLWIQYVNKALDFDLSAATAPSAAKYLTSSFWKTFIAPMGTAFPADTPLEIDVTLGGEPNVTSSASSGLVVDATLGLDFKANVNGTVKQACNLGLALTVGLDVFVNQTTSTPIIMFSLSDLDLKFSVVSSAIGSFSLLSLDALLGLVLPAVKSAIDKKLSQFGIPLPAIAGFDLVNPQVDYFPTYFAIAANATFTPGDAADALTTALQL